MPAGGSTDRLLRRSKFPPRLVCREALPERVFGSLRMPFLHLSLRSCVFSFFGLSVGLDDVDWFLLLNQPTYLG